MRNLITLKIAGFFQKLQNYPLRELKKVKFDYRIISKFLPTTVPALNNLAMLLFKIKELKILVKCLPGNPSQSKYLTVQSNETCASAEVIREHILDRDVPLTQAVKPYSVRDKNFTLPQTLHSPYS